MSIKNQSGFPLVEFTDLADLMEKISKDTSDWDGVWYRGVCGDYPILPKVLRTEGARETFILKSFRLKSLSHFSSVAADDYVRWICLAQHYGLPTRLIDWTQSVFTALYFSVASGDDKPYLWVLNPVRLNILSEKVSDLEISKKAFDLTWEQVMEEDSVGDRGVPLPDEETVVEFAAASFDEEIENTSTNPGLIPLPFLPDHFDKRISLQESSFTIHGDSQEPLDFLVRELAEDDASLGQLLRCYTASDDSLEKFKQQVKKFGLKSSILFGDVEGIVKEITSNH